MSSNWSFSAHFRVKSRVILLVLRNYGGSSIAACRLAVMDLSYVIVVLGAFCGLLSGEKVKRLAIEQWESTVKQTTDSWKGDGSYSDDVAHSVDVQQYYRQIFEEGWDEPGPEQPSTKLLHADGRVLTNEQQQAGTNRVAHSKLRKKIPGRYIVIFLEAADNDVVDHTIVKLQQLHWNSNQQVRAADFSPLRHVRKGFIATLNSRAVELVSWGIIT